MRPRRSDFVDCVEVWSRVRNRGRAEGVCEFGLVLLYDLSLSTCQFRFQGIYFKTAKELTNVRKRRGRERCDNLAVRQLDSLAERVARHGSVLKRQKRHGMTELNRLK